MPACSIHLLSLSCSIPEFVSTIRQTDLKPLTIARAIRWIILPSSISTNELLGENIHWHLLLILPNTNPLPSSLKAYITHQYTVNSGIPSRLLSNFAEKNQSLLHSTSNPPPLTGSLDKPRISASAQDLSLDPALQHFIASSDAPSGPVSMLNLLAFRPGKKESYLQYGGAFSKSIGSRRGGDAKLVGTVIRERAGGNEHREVKGEDGWDEIALAHYPSIQHFADMLASEDYQEVNQKFRVPSLRDTCILCTSEVELEAGSDVRAKL